MGKIKRLKFKDLPEHKKLLWLVSNNITPNDVLFLSEQDYGQGIEKHAERIADFRETFDTSKMDSWYPIEVWELNRWSDPTYTDRIGHSRRAFSCAALMACYFDEVGWYHEYLDTLLPLFESLIRLDLPDWRRHFSKFLLHGITKTEDPEDKFKIQLTFFLASEFESADLSTLKARYDQLMADEMSMLKYNWELMWNETWDPALEPDVERPKKIVDTDMTHRTTHMFAAKYIHQKSEQIEDVLLSEDLKILARRIAWLRKDDIDEFLPSSTIYL